MGDHVHQMGTMGPCNRKRTILIGNDDKHTVAGSQTIKVAFGSTEANFKAMQASITTLGNSKVTAQMSTLVKGQMVVDVASTGPATVRGAMVTLAASAGKKGMILCTSDICPATGQPYASPIHGAMGSPGHWLG